jgi:predicted DNA-binding transcriptional regulator AlpA
MTIEAMAGMPAGQNTRAPAVRISPWVNEPLPDVWGILCSRDLARLTRRPRWELFGLALIGKFPRKKRYRGRPIGWCKSEVLEWMTRKLTVTADDHERLNAPRRCERRQPRQTCLPLECGSRCTRAREYSERPARAGLSSKRFAHDDRNQCKGP